MPYQTPKILIGTAIIGSLFSGSMQPVVGIIFSYLLTALSTPIPMLTPSLDIDDGKAELRRTVEKYSIWMGVIALINFTSAIVAKNSYGNLGENVTLQIRRMLYESILRKNIGWFDLRENGVSVLTSAMA